MRRGGAVESGRDISESVLDAREIEDVEGTMYEKFFCLIYVNWVFFEKGACRGAYFWDYRYIHPPVHHRSPFNELYSDLLES